MDVSHDGLVGMTTSSEFDSPGIESQRGWDFPEPPRSAFLLYIKYRVIPSGKAAGEWR